MTKGFFNGSFIVLATSLRFPRAPCSQPPQSAVSKPSDAINLLVGFRPGAAYDLYARLTARYMLRYLPGNPAFVVENKPENAQETVRRIYREAGRAT
jgi:tripartite-type tricarboxylate transporter receptor subunit TctC